LKDTITVVTLRDMVIACGATQWTQMEDGNIVLYHALCSDFVASTSDYKNNLVVIVVIIVVPLLILMFLLLIVFIVWRVTKGIKTKSVRKIDENTEKNVFP